MKVPCVFLWAHHHIDAIFLQRRFVIGDITDPNDRGGAVMLQVLREKDSVTTWLIEWTFRWSFCILRIHIYISYLYEGSECAVCGVVCDQEPHVLVAQFHWSRTIHGGQGALCPTAVVIFVCYIDTLLSNKRWNSLVHGNENASAHIEIYNFFNLFSRNNCDNVIYLTKCIYLLKALSISSKLLLHIRLKQLKWYCVIILL